MPNACGTLSLQIVLVVASAAAYLATRRGVRRKDFAALAMGGVLFVASLMPQYFYARSETLLYNRVRILALEYFWPVAQQKKTVVRLGKSASRSGRRRES